MSDRVCGRGVWCGRLLGGLPFSLSCFFFFFCSHWQTQVVGTEAPELGSGCPSRQTAGAGSKGRVGRGSDRCSSAALAGEIQPLESAAMPLAKCLCEPFYAGFLLFLFKIRTRRKRSQVLSFQGEGKGSVRLCTCSAEHLSSRPATWPSCCLPPLAAPRTDLARRTGSRGVGAPQRVHPECHQRRVTPFGSGLSVQDGTG